MLSEFASVVLPPTGDPPLPCHRRQNYSLGYMRDLIRLLCVPFAPRRLIGVLCLLDAENDDVRVSAQQKRYAEEKAYLLRKDTPRRYPEEIRRSLSLLTWS